MKVAAILAIVIQLSASFHYHPSNIRKFSFLSKHYSTNIVDVDEVRTLRSPKEILLENAIQSKAELNEIILNVRLV